MCTKKRCLPVERIEPRQSSLTSDGCVPGTRFKSECNHCICTSTGVPVCTLKGCGVVRPLIPIINNNNIIDTGLVVRSRRQLSNQERIFSLQELNNPDFTCTPNYSFKVECNTCWCSADGKRPRFCTRIACKNSNNNNVYPTLAPLPPPTEKAVNVEWIYSSSLFIKAKKNVQRDERHFNKMKENMEIG